MIKTNQDLLIGSVNMFLHIMYTGSDQVLSDIALPLSPKQIIFLSEHLLFRQFIDFPETQ